MILVVIRHHAFTDGVMLGVLTITYGNGRFETCSVEMDNVDIHFIPNVSRITTSSLVLPLALREESVYDETCRMLRIYYAALAGREAHVWILTND